MSGYRSLHRQRVNVAEEQDKSSAPAPIWKVQTLALKEKWMVWTANGNGLVHGYDVLESTKDGTELDATAMKLVLRYELVGTNTSNNNNSKAALGCTQVSVVRNYTGDDELAGDLVVASIDLVGKVRIWNIPEEELVVDNAESETQTKKPLFEFQMENATGTTLSVWPPKNNGSNNYSDQNVLLAVGCLDGSICLVATGLTVPSRSNSKQKPPLEAGTVVETWGGGGTQRTGVACRLVWHPTVPQLLGVGRQDGTVDLYREGKRWHRLQRHSHPVRGVAFTPDGQLLLAGSDQGMICVWDLNRNQRVAPPPLVHHVMDAHDGWVLDLMACRDSRRFVTCGSDGRIHVWTLSGQGSYAPLHTFSTQDVDKTTDASSAKSSSSIPWTIHTNDSHNRLVAGTERGWLQVFSME